MEEEQKKKYHYPEVRIRGVGNVTKTEITNIASHIGVSENEWLKNELGKIIAAYPEKMRNSFKERK